MATATYNLPLREGATYRQSFKWLDGKRRPISLVGATVVAQVRDAPDSVDLIHELTVANGGIVLSASQGQITIHFSPVITAAFTFLKASWDLKITLPGGDVVYLIAGKVTMTRSVTV